MSEGSPATSTRDFVRCCRFVPVPRPYPRRFTRTARRDLGARRAGAPRRFALGRAIRARSCSKRTGRLPARPREQSVGTSQQLGDGLNGNERATNGQGRTSATNCSTGAKNFGVAKLAQSLALTVHHGAVPFHIPRSTIHVPCPTSTSNRTRRSSRGVARCRRPARASRRTRRCRRCVNR